VAHNDTTLGRLSRCPLPCPSAVTATMEPASRRRACVEFRAKLSRDTGVNLPAAACEALLGQTLTLAVSGEEVTLQSNPGLFYTSIGAAYEAQQLVVPDHLKVAWFCYREAAEVHQHPAGMGKLAECHLNGRGVAEDPAQAAVWFQKAADLGDARSKAALGAFFLYGDARARVAKDAAHGLALVCEAVEDGHGPALCLVAQCYMNGEGVVKDAVGGVTLLRQVINREDATKARAERLLTVCYREGDGVEADTVQAALWCQKAARSGDAQAIQLLPIIRRCDFCGTTPARQLCVRCRKVRYCGPACIAGHWNREMDPHKGPCKKLRRRAAEASQQEAGGTSAHQ